MKQKVILAVLAAVFFLLLMLGLVLSILELADDKAPAMPATSATETADPGTPAGTSQPDGTTLPAQTTAPDTDSTTPGATTPEATTVPTVTTVPAVTTTPTVTTPAPSTPAATAPAPTTPQHTHAYKAETTAPTLETEGYTVYTCACGHSYVGDKTPVLTLEQHVNALPLRPNPVGISSLDSKVQSVLASGNSTYNKLLAVHSYLRGCSQGKVDSSLSQMSAFAGNKVFKNVSELKFAYDAYQVFTNKTGQDEHFAAAFTVAAQALGLESYVVGNGSQYWSQVRLGNNFYIFDAYGGQNVFAKLPSEVSGYAGGLMGSQSGFQSAGEFVITLELKSDNGSTTRNHNWSVDKAGKGNDDFLQNALDAKLSGTVTYTITVTAKNGTVVIYDQSGVPQQADSLTGKLQPAAGKYTLLVEETSSGRSFRITIDN